MKSAAKVLAAGCLWGLISVFISILKKAGFDSMQCVAIRATFTALLLLVYLLITDRQKLKLRLRDFPCFLGTGLLSILFFNFCYFESLEVIGGAAVPALLMYTAPIFVMLLSAVLFHERITPMKVLALVLTLAGLAFVTGAVTGTASVTALGLLLGLGSGLGYALYSIFGKLVVNRYASVTITFYTFLVAAVGAVPLSGVLRQAAAFANIGVIGAGLGLAFFCTVLPFLLYTEGLKGIEAGMASIFATVEPLMAAVVGAVCFHEHFGLAKLVGMALVFGAMILLNLPSKRATA